MKKIIPILFLLCILCSCEDCDNVTYHKTIGVGYILVYDVDSNYLYPMQGARIIITTGLGYGFFSPELPEETFYTDENGKFQVRFIKRTRCRDATAYTFDDRVIRDYLGYTGYYSSSGGFPQLRPDHIINEANNTMSLDTLKLYKRY